MLEDDLDAPDLSHWGERLSLEDRLTKMFDTKGRQYFKDRPDDATTWERFFHFGPFLVLLNFVLFYKGAGALSGSFGYRMELKDWEHHDFSDYLQGQYDILKVIELAERGINELKAKPPTKTSEVVRAFHPAISYAYHKVHYPNETYEPE